MEAHHPHHVTHKKKWTEYLLEFFMLFLAVFLGFVAENIRETSVERHREEEYIKGLVKDLKRDTAALAGMMPAIKKKIEKMDSLVRLSKSDLSYPDTLTIVTRLALTDASWYHAIRSNTATLSQLRSGNFRLIQKKNANDSILRYDALNGILDILNQQYFEVYNNFSYTAQAVFDLTIMVDTSYLKRGQLLKTPPLLTRNKEKISLYFNKLTSLLGKTRQYYTFLENRLATAKRLIRFLQESYHLQNE